MRLLPQISVSGDLQFYWIDPNGVTRDLNKATSPKLFVISGSRGLGASDVEVVASKLPKSPGTLINQLNVGAREMEVPIIIYEDSIGDLILTSEDIAGWFDTGDEEEKRPGYLEIIRPDNSIRRILCYKTEGMLGDTSEGSPNFCVYTVALYAPDPAPTAQSSTIINKSVAEVFNGGLGFGVLNEGTKEAYPVWTITGPFSGLDLLNVTTGELATFNLGLLVGQSIIIDTRPSESRPTALQVYRNDGLSFMQFVAPTSKFWHLKPGTNIILVNFTGGGTTAATRVNLEFLPRYRTMLR